MRKSTLAFSLLGIIVACFVAYLGAYLALVTLQGSPAAQTNFVIGLILNIVAALVLAASTFAEDVVKAKPKVPGFLKATYRFWTWVLVLGLVALSAYVIGEAIDSFRTVMAFVAFPCGLVVLACVGAIVKEITRCFQGKKSTV